MSIYRIATPAITDSEGDDKQSVIHVRFASSNKTARAAKKELMEEHDLKNGDIEVTEVEVRRGKVGLIEYLNGFHAQQPAGYEPAGYSTKAPPARKRKAKKKVTKK